MLSFVILFHGTLPPTLGVSHLFHSTLCCGHAGMYVFPSLGLTLNSQEENKIYRCHFWTFPKSHYLGGRRGLQQGLRCGQQGLRCDDESESFCSDEPQEIGGGQLFTQMFFVVTL
jgi:hypothetical protein